MGTTELKIDIQTVRTETANLSDSLNQKIFAPGKEPSQRFVEQDIRLNEETL